MFALPSRILPSTETQRRCFTRDTRCTPKSQEARGLQSARLFYFRFSGFDFRSLPYLFQRFDGAIEAFDFVSQEIPACA